MNTTSHYHRLPFKVTLLSLSTLTIVAGAAVAPGLSQIAHYWHQVPTLWIKMVLSLPPLIMGMTALFSNVWARYFAPQQIVAFGLCLFLVGGIGAGYVNRFGLLLAARVLLGLGTGMLLPYTTGLIHACYQGQEKQKMLGFSVAMNNLGAILCNFAAGWLAVKGWRPLFLLYWVALPVLLLVLAYFRKLPVAKSKQKVSLKGEQHIFFIAFCAFGVMMIFFTVLTTFPFLMDERHPDSTGQTGMFLALNAFMMMLGGFLYSITSRLKNMFVPFCLILLALGLGGISYFFAISGIIASIACLGFALGSLFPHLLNQLRGHLSTAQNIKAMGIVMGCAWLGQFAAPVIFESLRRCLQISAPEMLTLFGLGIMGVMVLYGVWQWIFCSDKSTSEI